MVSAQLKKIVLASNNQGKLQELQSILANYKCISQGELGIEEVEETGTTFIENAIIKAKNAAAYANMPALADDSGLVVPALNGDPGVYSARYAHKNAKDSENIDKLLSELKPNQSRKAYFYCVIAYMGSATDPTPIIAEGVWHGEILNAPKGTGGFGYDPIFLVPEYGKSAAELDRILKNKISHRAKALANLCTRTLA